MEKEISLKNETTVTINKNDTKIYYILDESFKIEKEDDVKIHVKINGKEFKCGTQHVDNKIMNFINPKLLKDKGEHDASLVVYTDDEEKYKIDFKYVVE